MICLIHALLGSLIGETFNSVIMIALLGILSHFALDMIPHWEGFFDKEKFHNKNKLGFRKKPVFTVGFHAFDVILTIILIYQLGTHIPGQHIVLGACLALFPDMLKAGYFFGFKKSKKYMGYLKFHSKIQKDTTWKIGILTQVIAIVVILSFLL